MNSMPFDPNGMCMDLLRSCYRSKVSYVSGDASIQADCYWYFCGPEALPFPGEHAFGSSIWDASHPTPTTLGWDASKGRVYYTGARKNRSSGRSYAGPRSYFLDGAPGPSAIERGTDGTPVECLIPPFGIAVGGSVQPVGALVGGIVVSGSIEPGITPGVPCANCSGVTPLTVTVTASGFTGAESVYNGSHQLTQTASPCRWTKTFGFPLDIDALRGPGGSWSVIYGHLPNIAQYTATTTDCVSLEALPQTFSTIGGSSTANIVAP